jgi:hypothetical protein
VSAETDYARLQKNLNLSAGIIVKKAHWIVLAGLVAGGLAYAASYLIKPTFESESQFIVGKSGGNGQMGALASIVGLSGKSEGDPNLFSEATLDDLIHSPHVTDTLLHERWKTLQDDREHFMHELLQFDSSKMKIPHAGVSRTEIFEKYALESLASAMELKQAPSGIWKLTTRFSDPLVAQQINAVTLRVIRSVAESEKFNKGAKNRAFLERRFDVTLRELQDAESVLGRFLSANRSVQDPSIAQRQRAIQRVVQMKEAVHLEIGKQLELARIEEAKVQNSIVVFSEPEMPLFKSRPKRAQMAVIGSFLGGALSVSIFLLLGLRRKMEE